MAFKESNRPIGITLRDQEHLQRSLGYNIKWSSPSTYRLEIPSLPQEAFKRGEMYLLYTLVDLMGCTPYYIPLCSTDPDEKVSFFLLTYHVEANPSMYLKTTPKCPLIVDSYINYAKTTSRSVGHIVRHPDVNSPLAVFTGIDVHVDPETRRPKPIPEWWKQKYAPPGLGRQHRPEIIFPDKPQYGVFGREQTICFSDIDFNKHTHFICYARLCLDTFYDVISADELGDFYHKFLMGWIKELHINCKGESKLGDILRINFWEDITSKNKFCFEISKDKEVIYTACITFYQSLIGSNI